MSEFRIVPVIVARCPMYRVERKTGYKFLCFSQTLWWHETLADTVEQAEGFIKHLNSKEIEK